jgi:hypothetical protein
VFSLGLVRRATLITFSIVGAAAFVTAQQPSNDAEQDRIVRAMKEEADRQVMLGGAQRRFETPAGRAYANKFIKALRPSLLAAMRACDQPQSQPDASHDIVFVVRSTGKIQRVLQRSENPYAECIVSHVALPDTAPKPPDSPWFVQVHLVNGPRDASGSHQPYATLSLPGKR